MTISRRTFALSVPLALALAACGKTTPGESNSPKTAADDAIPKSMPITVEAVKKYAKGFDVGQMMSQRQVFVFFDPKCPHCAAFWYETKSLEGSARFTWIPVALLGRGSVPQGAHILTAADRIAAMDEHAKQVTAGTGGVSASSSVPEDIERTIMRNTAVLESFGATGVPFIVAQNQLTGAVFSKSGGLSSQDLASTLGWN